MAQPLHVQATALMDADRVRPAQAKSYQGIMSQVSPILVALPGVENAHGVGAEIPAAQAKQLRAIMVAAKLPNSHIWVKGLVAVYCALQHGPKQS